MIRLNAKDLEAWRKDYPNLSLEAELRSLSEWAGRPENAKGWFHAVQGGLAKRNRESALAVERVKAEATARAHAPRLGSPQLMSREPCDAHHLGHPRRPRRQAPINSARQSEGPLPPMLASTKEKARAVPVGLDRRQGGSISMPQRRLRLAWGTFL